MKKSRNIFSPGRCWISFWSEGLQNKFLTFAGLISEGRFWYTGFKSNYY
jgi:hypothetical protein